jgi:hypothetical protein
MSVSLGNPMNMKLHYVLGHYHSYGNLVSISTLDASGNETPVLTIDSSAGEALGHLFPEPVDLGALGATGLRFTCGFANTTDRTIGWGIGDEEMCEALGFAEMDYLFDAGVRQTSEEWTDEDGVAWRTGDCEVLALPFE